MRNNVEILAPAGSRESLEAAVHAGADAVYLGGKRFGARAYADNFGEEELLSAIDYVHIHGKRLYLTVNTLFKEKEMEELYSYLVPCYREGLDAVIVQDIGAMDFIREAFPALPVHVSTQATVTGVYGAAFFQEKGAVRIVPARELCLGEVKGIKEQTGMEVECFVHGALCYCYSGQCLFSSLLGGRSGNRGQCAQPCRLPYMVRDHKKRDILSLKDLCTIDMLPELIETGIDSFKVEGRMKQPDYVYTVVSMYRKYADLYQEHGKKGFAISDRDKNFLQGSYKRRGYTRGYYKQHNGKDMISFYRPEESPGEGLPVPQYKMQEKINGKLILSKGERVKLYIGTKETNIFCEGDRVQQAQKQPLDAARIEKQMRKTGSTEFVFEQLDVLAEKDIFLPVQSLNELRRYGIRKLEEQILAGYCREIQGDERKSLKDQFREPEEMQPELSVLVTDRMYLDLVLGDKYIDTVYVDENTGFDAVRTGNKGKKVFLAMPYIFRENAVSRWNKLYSEIVRCFDGVLVRNIDGFQWLKKKGYPKEIRSDDNLYVFNRWSKKAVKDMGITRFFAPAELNGRELKELGIVGEGLIVYGNHPVMISANCIQKNTKGCLGKEKRLYLTDRYQKKFAVKNWCTDCYNVIYNCQPLMLLSQSGEIKGLHPGELRMDLTFESLKEAEQLIRIFGECFKENLSVPVPDMDYTKGHFKRGVK